MYDNKCIGCGVTVPEGRMICPNCEVDVPKKYLTIKIKFDTFNGVTEFVNLMNRCACAVTVYSGRYIINGKSLMGLYSLNLTKPIMVEFGGEIPKDVNESIKKYIVEER